MTPEQYDRWQDFARRMARTCFTHLRRPDTAWIVAVVDDFFDGFEERDVVCITDWDNSDPYPEGHDWFRRTYRCPCWHCGDGKPKSECPYRTCEDGQIYDYAHPYPVCDQVSIFLSDYEPGIECQSCRDSTAKPCRCDEAEDLGRDQWDEQWGGPVHCCIRAGLDVASAPSAGVVGFTVCDLRNMYPEGIPDWVNSEYRDPNGHPVDLNQGECNVGIWL